MALLAAMLCPSGAAKAANESSPEITRSNILHCFSWPIKYIREELPNIAAAGFGAIQISPMQRPDINEGDTWYNIYLPYDYGVFSSPGMGSREDLRDLCSEAEARGLKIIVDVALNHVNKTEPYYNPWWKDDDHRRYRTWGSEGKTIDYNSRYSITHDPLGDYAELNTEIPEVSARGKAFMEELKALGVSAIRFDAAKHIELPSEVTEGVDRDKSMWPVVTSVPDLFYYGEIVGECVNGNDSKIKEYAEYIWVPDNMYATWAARENGGVPQAHAGGRDADNMARGQLIYWAESHDDYSNDEWSERRDQGVIDRAYCALACRNKQAALYYSRPRARGKDNIKIEKGSTSFLSKQVVEVNKFRKAMQGKADYFTKYDNNEVACVTRENGGAVIVAKGSNVYVTVENGGGYCPKGNYTDRISGNEFVVEDRDGKNLICGTVGPTGVAIIYEEGYQETTHDRVTITGEKQYNVAYAGNFSNGNNYIHYWSSKNENRHTDWPGVKMERAKGDDGKYYWCYNVPSDCDMVIFNNGNSFDKGGMQTGDLPLVSNYVMDNGGATIVPVSFVTGSFEPEPTPAPASVTIEGDYNLAYQGKFSHIHYWSSTDDKKTTTWPGERMTPVKDNDGRDYWCYKLPAGYDMVIFNNGETATGQNMQTGNLHYTGDYVMGESGAKTISLSFTINGQPINPEPEAIPVIWPNDSYCYFFDENNWGENNIKIHAWNSSGNLTTFPGVKMTKANDKYIWKVPSGDRYPENILVSNNGSDDVRTGDQKFVNAATYFPSGGHTGGETTKNDNPSPLYMFGNLPDNNWDFTNGDVKLIKVDDKGIYIGTNITINKADNNDYGYFHFGAATGNTNDIDKNPNGGRFGPVEDGTLVNTNTPGNVTRYAGGNSWKVLPGTYDIIVDLYNMTVTLLEPQAAPKVEALQLVKVQENAGTEAIQQFDYITYPADNGKAYGVNVSGETIEVDPNVTVSDAVYHNSNEVLFTEKVLVTTTLTGNNGYNIEPMSASMGSKQSDGKFRAIRVLHNLNETTLKSKVNYYYTIHEGVDVKVPMQSPEASATVRLAVPEPKLICKGVSVTKSDERMAFNYEGIDFDAYYNKAFTSVEIEQPNVTPELAILAKNLYQVTANGMNLSGDTYHGVTVSPEDLVGPNFTLQLPQTDLIAGSAASTGRWDNSQDNVATSVKMTVEPPTIEDCEIISSFLEYVNVEAESVMEEHLIDKTTVKLDVSSRGNKIILGSNNDKELKVIDLDHSAEGDWYLVEFCYDDKPVAKSIVEGSDAVSEFELIYDYGKHTPGMSGATTRWYEREDGHFTVCVSMLYPFATASPLAFNTPFRRVPESRVNGAIVESRAASHDITSENVETGVDSIGAEPWSGEVMYFNLQGIRVERPEAPGIYVVRHSDGKTSKILVK